MPDNPSPGYWVLGTLIAFIAASVWLGTVAQRAMSKQRFLEGFFLGNRGLGAWALALTATVQSGGTFMGFPALVYSHGWIVTLWIASYMIVPLTGFAIVGKRLAQISRKTQTVTVPDMFRERFGDARVGLVASLLIMFFLSFTMIAQFKAGATVMKLAIPGNGVMTLSEDLDSDAGQTSSGQTVKASAPASNGLDTMYYVGLAVFGVTVVGYTMIGGFLASVWTDLFQSVMMAIGVMILVCLAVPAAGGLEAATLTSMQKAAPAYAFGPGYEPGGREFLPVGLAVSMFFIWVYAGFATPASMIRVMAAQNTEVMRKSIALLAAYNCLIYIPLIMICIAARAILPELSQPDEVIPRIAMHVTQKLPLGSLLTGLILAAPFGAIMASVSCFVLVIASGLVQDIYLRFLNPTASQAQIRFVTRGAMVLVGLVGILACLYPPKYLQALVVFSGSAGAATFVTPALMACYWRRSSAGGVLAAMLIGFGVYLGLFATGWVHNWALSFAESDSQGTFAGLAAQIVQLLGPDPKIGLASMFRPYYLLGVDPVLWGLGASAIAGVVGSLCTSPPPAELVAKFFDAAPAKPVKV